MLEKIREASKSALTESRRKYEFLCYHDALTGLYNRFWLQSVIDNPEQYHLKPAAVAVLDIDNFKFINDNFGHPSGDIVIKDIGQAIVDTLNGSGDVCRWGGDEFLIIFHTDIDAEMVCKRIVDNVCAHRFVFDKENFNTTVSVGLVLAPNGGTDDIGKLIHQADINLYHAKDYGKNCTINSELKP
ncbi:MAG: GGDEF domain-containing protein [Ruminococcus sp.]|nr:GGDEF domain-containing protein [uncultured Ruminococcus sp.]MBQ1474305.1 GGDEF domain-containing protein [Ruminococcus sp.]